MINHFPGIHGIARKVPLCQNMECMQRKFGLDQYGFYPQAWCLPTEISKFKKWRESNKNRKEAFIIKPNAGSLGRGIILTMDPEMEIQRHAGEAVVQRYIDNPYLIENHKFDLRVYVLITCIDPLRIYMYQEGIVRMCTEPYEMPTTANVRTPFQHLTNYTLNKKNPNFKRAQKSQKQFNEKNPQVQDEFTTGFKRSFRFLNDHFRQHGIDSKKVWHDISDMLVKSVMSIQPSVKRMYERCTMGSKKGSLSTCFEVLGFDVLLDENLKPWLLEVNHSPSLNLETPLDRVVKLGLIKECFQLLNIDPNDRVNYMRRQSMEARARIKGEQMDEEQLSSIPDLSFRRKTVEEQLEDTRERERKYMNKYKLIYPAKRTQKYDVFIANGGRMMRRSAGMAKVPAKPKIEDEPDF